MNKTILALLLGVLLIPSVSFAQSLEAENAAYLRIVELLKEQIAVLQEQIEDLKELSEESKEDSREDEEEISFNPKHRHEYLIELSAELFNESNKLTEERRDVCPSAKERSMGVYRKRCDEVNNRIKEIGKEQREIKEELTALERFI